MAPCGLCGSANLSSGFYPCCGSSVCDMCYTTTMVCSRSTLRPVKPCPSCGEIGPRQDEDGLRGAYKTLADKGHTEAGERLVVLLTTMVAKRPELMEEYEHCSGRRGAEETRPPRRHCRSSPTWSFGR